jgi:CHAT domain-containing protein
VYALDIQQDDLAKRIAKFRAEVSDPNRPVDSAGSLYDLLLKPAQAQLQGKTTLVIVPDGALWELPFQALQPKESRYLLEDAAIFYAPSLTVLREMERHGSGFWVLGSGGTAPKTQNPKPKTSAVLLAFGNPSFSQATVERVQLVKRDANLAPLPQAEKEVKSLAQLYGTGRSKVYVGVDAREERMKAEAAQYRILHFATHGLLNDASPMYSHLLLAQTPETGKMEDGKWKMDSGGAAVFHSPFSILHSPEDGLLEAWEIMNLNLTADLVVLSACETARGRWGTGEGVIGLTWALFVAGCPTTVVSQWKVADESTSQLMVEFHRQLKSQIPNPKSQIGKAEALRQAALQLRRGKQYRHPFYWAGFVVVGDGF